MLRWYPPRFRREFAGEIQDVFLSRMDEPGNQAGVALQETAALAWSILRERWHEWRTKKGGEMDREHELSSEGGDAAVLRPVGVTILGFSWVIYWILLPLTIIPLAKFMEYPFSMVYQWIFNQGAQAGLWPAVPWRTLHTLGFMTGLGLSTGATQWFLLRGRLPRSGRWFSATAIGIWLGGIIGVILDLEGLVYSGRTPDWSHPLELIVFGVILGLTQWHFLRDQIDKAFWFVAIDTIAALSFLPIQYEFFLTFLLVFLPGVITGVGLWLLLKNTMVKRPFTQISTPVGSFSSSSKFWIGTGLAVLIIGGLWLNASIRLDQANAQGTYATFEEVVIAHAKLFEKQGVQIRSIEVDNEHGTPAVMDGKRQHLRWGCSIIQQEENPANDFGASFPTCAAFIHTRDGWARIDEDHARFVADMMELYNLEGLREFRAGNSQ